MRSNITTAIDRLGELRAQIAELEREADTIKAVVTELGVGAYEGERFRATVSQFDRETLDMAAVREKLSPQWIRAHTNVKAVTVVRVTARSNINVA